MVYVCLICGFWKVSSGLAEALIKGFAQSDTIKVSYQCPECHQDLYAVEVGDKLMVHPVEIAEEKL